MSMEDLYPHHIVQCGKPHFAANAARCAQLQKILIRQYGTEFAEKAMAQVNEQGFLTAYQYWFGCYYPSNEDTAMTAEGYRKFLRNKGLDLDENGMR